MQGRSRRTANAGFSFIEILIGIAILGIVAGGVIMGFTASSAQIAKSRLDSEASKIAQGKLEQISRMQYDDIGVVGGNPDGTIPPSSNESVSGTDFAITTAVAFVDDPTPGRTRNYINYKKVTVTVTPQKAIGEAVTQSTLLSPPTFGTIRNKATAVITALDAISGTPIKDATVTLFGSTSPTRTQATAIDGKATFGGLEPSSADSASPTYYYRAKADLLGYVTDSGFGPDDIKQSLAAGQTWTSVIQMFKPATINVFVRDEMGNAVTEYTELTVTVPDGGSPKTEVFAFPGGANTTLSTIAGKPIRPDLNNETTIKLRSDCYADPADIKLKVPAVYPSVPSQDFVFTLKGEAQRGFIRITVRDIATGLPIPNAAVSVSGGEKGVTAAVRKTDAAGFTRFCLPKSDKTPYTVSVASAGYPGATMTLTLPQGTTVDQTIQMVRAASCELHVRHRLGKGKLVKITSRTVTFDQVLTTNDMGIAVFKPIPPGVYDISLQTGFSDGQPTFTLDQTTSSLRCPNTYTATVPR